MRDLRRYKQHLCDLLLTALQATDEFSDLVSLTYSWDEYGNELVRAAFMSGYEKRANVSMDSGSAMYRDILEQIR